MTRNIFIKLGGKQYTMEETCKEGRGAMVTIGKEEFMID